MAEIRIYDDIPYQEYDATCDNDSCENFGLPLAVWGEVDDPEIGCGACGRENIPYETKEES